jgi:hypothetical protein
VRRGLLSVLATATVSLASASSASAATEVGTVCTSNASYVGTVIPVSKAGGDSLPLTAPIAGVVTRWKVNHGSFETHLVRLKVARPAGETGKFLITGESSSERTVKGTNEFDTRIPVQAGDRFGVYSPTQAPLCATISLDDRWAALNGEADVGSTANFLVGPDARVPVSVTIEPDADGDGFGDETQDKCPLIASLSDCPPISISSFGLARRSSALVLVSANGSATVDVSGSVSLPKARRRRVKPARASAQLRLTAPTQAVEDGQIGRFMLRFPPALRASLATLPRKRSVTLDVTSTATDPAGQRSSSRLSIRLKGQKRKLSRPRTR